MTPTNVSIPAFPAIQLSDEVEGGAGYCEVNPEHCQNLCYAYGATGFNGYVTVCPLHAQQAVDTAIADGRMVPEEA